MSDLEKKQQISRENGRKSKGPITPEGKKRSSLNSVTHGLASKCVVLATESQEAYDDLAAKYQQEWQPVSVTETHLLTQMVNSCWRLRRAPEIAPTLPAPGSLPETASEPVERLPQPAAPANWLTRLLAVLVSFFTVILAKAPKRRKSTQKRTRQSNEPISLAEESFWTFEFPEFFTWLTSFITKTGAPVSEIPPQSE
ncbi:MAG: hypothetical protein IT167_08835 [Bryobacterales bacterium]|nr:hypothetical protein [Bryobacterales bacterium]